MRFRVHLSRPFILAGAISLPLLVGAASPPLVDHLRMLTTTFVSPVLEVQAQITRFAQDQTRALLELPHLRRNNEVLRSEVQGLKRDLVRLEELKQERARLEELLHLKKSFSGKVVAAHVIQHDPSLWGHYIVIDKGEADGIRENTILMNSQGLVGKAVSTGAHSSRAILLVDHESRVSAMNQRTRDVGLAGGNDTLLLRMIYLDRDAQIAIGDTIITSGLGGVYPKGIPIGTVQMIGEDETELTLFAVVKPFVPFSKLEEVLCVFFTTES
ncbi:MAG: rod shape-determining protein MreC [Omnitrophica bacterium RIFCSPLOWO2_01_FULL_50_24]|nr:MAG: rod shape-determining protein MreC [Omnitrophica bacterium RIFCSPLOWO2_01_FULL_50_24]